MTEKLVHVWLLIIITLAGCDSEQRNEHSAIRDSDFTGQYSLGLGHSPAIDVTFSDGDYFMSSYTEGISYDPARWSRPTACEPVSASALNEIFGDSWQSAVRAGIINKKLNSAIFYVEKNTLLKVNKFPYNALRQAISTSTGYIYLDSRWIGEATKFDKNSVDPILDYMRDVKIDGVIKLREQFDTVVKHFGSIDSTSARKEYGQTYVYYYCKGVMFVRFGNILQIKRIDFKSSPNLFVAHSKGKFDRSTTLDEVGRLFPKSYKNYVGKYGTGQEYMVPISPEITRTNEAWRLWFQPETKRLKTISFW